MKSRALLIDLYELTMAAGYAEHGKATDSAAFDLYYRQNPYEGGYGIAAGMEVAVRAALEMRFSAEDLQYLRSLRTNAGSPLFHEWFLDLLSDFRFRGSIRGIPEGTVVFPDEPLLQVSGRLMECQLLESILLCHINFQTLVATKAARMWEASNHGNIVEFGLRRSQGPDGALSACRAAIIGGADATSNVLGSAILEVPARGTHAHSWVQSFPSEIEAFRFFAGSFPDDCVLLVDTYDVLKSGLPNAITVARELEQQGHRLAGIRIDSGDLAVLSREARAMLDRAGFDYVKIVASNELDEFSIAQILAGDGRIDIWGVGTNLVTGAGQSALGGIYKLVEHNGAPKIKISGNPEKMTNPGAKKVIRLFNRDGLMEADALARGSEPIDPDGLLLVDPMNPSRRRRITGMRCAELLADIVKDGIVVYEFPSLEEIRARRREQLCVLPEDYRRLRNPRRYSVWLSHALWSLKEQMLARAAV